MIRRFLTQILMVILIAACVYNGWQVQQLKAQVAMLQGQPETKPIAHPEKSERAANDAALAKAALLKGDFQGANKHLEHGFVAIKESTLETQARTEHAVSELQHVLASLQGQKH